MLFTYALHRRFQAQGKALTVVAFDPGLMPGTNLAREAGPFLKWGWYHVLPRMLPVLRRVFNPNIHTAKESGETLAWLAVGDEVKGVSGVYYEVSPERKTRKSSKDSYDEGKQEDLWAWTVKNVSASEEERKKFDALG